MRKSFMFYLNWKTQLDILSDKELRRFIYNLISWHQDENVELNTKTDLLVWNGVLPALEVNDDKWNSRADKSRENGKRGGRPKKEITQETQQVISEPKKPVNSKLLNDNSEKVTEKGKEINVEGKLKNEKSKMLKEEGEMEEVNGKQVIDNTNKNNGESISTFLRREINNCISILDNEFSHLPYLKSFANPEGIKELSNHLDDDELVKVKPLIEKLSDFKFKLRGNYE